MEHRRPDPDEILRQLQAQDRHSSRGRLKVFLGYASGVGKSLRMFEEGRRRRMRGADVVVAASQPRTTADVEGLLKGFEVIPGVLDLGGEALDLDALLRRKPEVALIDGLAYDNPPGSKHPERWQDVEDLLAAGISVITSINLQYVKEKQPQVEALRGKRTKEAVPESFLRTADEIEVVDAPPEYCLTRAPGGDATEGVDVLRQERQLSELREMALLLAAEVVDHQLAGYLQRHGLTQIYGTHERILVCATPGADVPLMIRRGRRQADRFHGELHVVHVLDETPPAGTETKLEEQLAAEREAHARVEVLLGSDPVRAILRYAQAHGITQIFVGHGQEPRLLGRFRPRLIERLVEEADGIDVRIFPRAS